jgi:integrase/recombinase XerD
MTVQFTAPAHPDTSSAMTPLRQRMVEDMRVRNLSANTQRAYLQQVRAFAKHFGRSPATLGPEEIRAWQLHLVQVRQLARSTLVTATAALRFLYTVTLKRDCAVDDIVMSKKPRTLPVILSREEVTISLESIRSFKHRTILMAAYAGGLRISELTRLKVSDIDSQRMVLRVEQGKGQVDRYVMLSPRLLEILRTYWQAGRPQHWLSPGRFPDQPIDPATIRLACSWPVAGPASASLSRRTRCVTRSPRIYSNRVPTCGPSSCCSAIAASPPPRAI